MPLTHNTLMTLPLNKMIADTNGLYFKRTGPQKGTWTFRYMRHGRARTMSLGPYLENQLKKSSLYLNLSSI